MSKMKHIMEVTNSSFEYCSCLTWVPCY